MPKKGRQQFYQCRINGINV